jgi:ADP-ribose pyrophosphatase YjhB (NUDIX family)
VTGDGHAPILPEVGELAEWKYCPRCGASVEPVGNGARIECDACGLRHYASAKPTASALIVDDDGQVLLARRAREPDRGKWDLPGGFLEEVEDPLDGLRRELLEETGLRVEPIAFSDVVVDRYGDEGNAPHTLNLYWICRAVSGEPQPQDDVAELRWFPRDELPSREELAFRNNAEVLLRWRQQHA